MAGDRDRGSAWRVHRSESWQWSRRRCRDENAVEPSQHRGWITLSVRPRVGVNSGCVVLCKCFVRSPFVVLPLCTCWRKVVVRCNVCIHSTYVHGCVGRSCRGCKVLCAVNPTQVFCDLRYRSEGHREAGLGYSRRRQLLCAATRSTHTLETAPRLPEQH